MMNFLIDLFGSTFFLSVFVLLLIGFINDIKTEKERKKRYPKPKELPIEKQRTKICTQTQPFMVSEKKGIICNFSCDGICTLVKHF